ncbi:adenine DNA methyltransferase [Mycobacteroides abscessus 5S-0422]|uniref:Methyltransferase n=1 Tax=Mycobacteroides abscessus subsp. bolletii 1513 TaxID=1299321 RepID=X8DGZ1_9MYCO|nr:site-specific DNA-methyltransferase [Mycobacteroides abscessus]EUA67912.1 DNA methylase family protein [Mycobacteroides abscessus subsp. bolletii 1513]EIU03701.1 adenine DNA methyltransferase [Mycobacteroides abscessus 5S-0422]EIU07059.1 adenine DNA methyltransferase [Mycobacteroides abscessus 5S-0421]EIU11392.1 adenine DNA methyltransferase [Mycobacteroides abscessus 5S-0304]EIU20883.1 adenine DNA methyltransferase [Mycobacteroides abscessus 5S-0708]
MNPHYQDESATLYQGDALAVLATLPTASVDAIITDPPYSSGGMVRSDRMGSTRTKYVDSGAKHDLADFGGDNRDQRAYEYWCALWLAECLRITKPGGALVQFTDWRQLPSTSDAIQAGGWIWRGIVPWIKPTARPQMGRFTASAEYILWGTNGAKEIDMKNGTQRVHEGYHLLSAPRDRQHITQKPVELMRKLVGIAEGGTVLDPFMGSGTTGVAAMLEGSTFIGIEHSAHYTEIAAERIRCATGKAVAVGSQDALDFEAGA